jgi:NADH-quinone oxidoreductase subunit C
MTDVTNIISNLILHQKLDVVSLDMPHFISYESSSTSLESFLTLIKTSEDLRFTILTDLFAADFPSRTKRFEVVYNLLSLKLNKRILVKVYINESDGVPSVSRIFSAACWYEREAYDMYGINFTGSHDTRRILTDYGFEGFPLRKDFPLYGYVQVKYDDITNKVVYEPVKLDQKYREFDFASPWNGPKYVLPGDEKAQK